MGKVICMTISRF